MKVRVNKEGLMGSKSRPHKRKNKILPRKAKHKKTGLYITEVLGTRKYSNQPRGCSLSYMIHYMGGFAPTRAKEQWKLYKKNMLKKDPIYNCTRCHRRETNLERRLLFLKKKG